MQNNLYLFFILFFAGIFVAAMIFRQPEPVVFLLIIFLSVLSYLTRVVGNNTVNNAEHTAEEFQRRAALKEAKIFLAPYKDIWRDLKLSNKYCTLILCHDGITIKCIEKVSPYRSLRVTQTHIHTPQELWNMFCLYFSYNKSYDGVLEDCYKFHAATIETLSDSQSNNTISRNVDITQSKSNQNILIPLERLDINNCSEIELTELPGVSIVLAKKAIKKREEIGGFKSTDEFLKFLKLKPHMENQLRQRIKVEKMKGSLDIKKYKERSVDF